MTTRIFERTMSELIECIKHGSLFIVERVHGNKIVCHRVRNLRGNIVATKERQTFERRAEALMQPERRDFIFVDKPNAGRKPALSLFKVKHGKVTRCENCNSPHTEGDPCVCGYAAQLGDTSQCQRTDLQ